MVTVVVGIGYLIVAVLALPVIAGDEYRVVVPWMWPIVPADNQVCHVTPEHPRVE